MNIFQLCCEYSIRAWTCKLLDKDFDPEAQSTDAPNRSPRRAKSPKLLKAEPGSSDAKPGVEIEDGDLIGTVLQLPESTNPYKIAAELYTEFTNYFGDSLSAKLPVEDVEDFYVDIRQDTLVDLGSEESKKSGEQLLHQILNAPSITPVASASRLGSSGNPTDEPRSENHSAYDFTPDDEKSERSSRSDRSHSDDLSFLGDDTDLTVKATVSDPSLGIKLTIAKLPKFKTLSPKAPELKRRRLKSDRITEVFDRPPLKRPKEFMVFRYQGMEKFCQRSQYSRRGFLEQQSRELHTQQSEYRILCTQLKSVGKKTQKTVSASKKWNKMHVHSATLNNVL